MFGTPLVINALSVGRCAASLTCDDLTITVNNSTDFELATLVTGFDGSGSELADPLVGFECASPTIGDIPSLQSSLNSANNGNMVTGSVDCGVDLSDGSLPTCTIDLTFGARLEQRVLPSSLCCCSSRRCAAVAARLQLTAEPC